MHICVCMYICINIQPSICMYWHTVCIISIFFIWSLTSLMHSYALIFYLFLIIPKLLQCVFLYSVYNLTHTYMTFCRNESFDLIYSRGVSEASGSSLIRQSISESEWKVPQGLFQPGWRSLGTERCLILHSEVVPFRNAFDCEEQVLLHSMDERSDKSSIEFTKSVLIQIYASAREQFENLQRENY